MCHAVSLNRNISFAGGRQECVENKIMSPRSFPGNDCFQSNKDVLASFGFLDKKNPSQTQRQSHREKTNKLRLMKNRNVCSDVTSAPVCLSVDLDVSCRRFPQSPST